MAVAVDMHPNTRVIIKIATRPIQKVDQSSGFRKSRRLLQKPDGLDSYMVYMVSIRSLPSMGVPSLSMRKDIQPIWIDPDGTP